MSTPQRKSEKLALLLAGGGSRRFGASDKAEALIDGERLIDRVYARLSSQVDDVFLSADRDYEVEALTLADRVDGPVGPAAGVFALWRYLDDNSFEADGFVTAPADAPFVSLDLFSLLYSDTRSQVLIDATGRNHPTFAYWRRVDLAKAFAGRRAGEGVALNALAEACHVRRVVTPDEIALFNVNTIEDLAHAKAHMA